MSKRIDVKGPVVPSDEAWIYDMFGIEHASPAGIVQAMEDAEGQDLEININSGGGDVHSASEIYTDLKSYPGNVETRVIGLAASAASVIAMAGSKVKMAPTAEMMIHNSATIALGDHRDMNDVSNMLKTTDRAIANAYRLKTGMDEQELLDLMGAETWLSPQDAKEKGMVDEILFEDDIKISASTGVTNMLPREVIDSVRQGKFDANKQSDNDRAKQAFEETEDKIKEIIKEEIGNHLGGKKDPEPPEPEPTQKNMSKLFLKLQRGDG